MDKSRRTYIRDLGVILAGSSVPFAFSGCEKEPLSYGVENFEDYFPNVNNPPWIERDFNVEEGFSDEKGEIHYSKRPGRVIIMDEKSKNYLSGIRGIRYGTINPVGSDNIFDFVQDPSGIHMPDFARINQYGQGSSTLLRKQNSPLINNSLRVQKAKGNLNYYSPESINNFLKGFVNKGQGAIISDRDFIHRMKKGDLFMGNIENGNIGIASCIPGWEIASLQPEYFIPAMNQTADLEIQDRKNYQFYELPLKNMGTFLLFYDPKNHVEKESVDIKDLFPLQVWNYWKYNNNLEWRTVHAQQSGYKDINGKNLIFYQNSDGLREYLGFEGLELKFYGGANPGLSSEVVVFDPPIKFGDEKIKLGTKYPIKSNVLVEGLGNFGIVEGEVHWDKKEDLLLHEGDENLQETYGECYRLNQHLQIKLEHNGESFWQNIRSRKWFAENVGPIKEEEIDLVTGEILKSYSLLDFDVSGIGDFIPSNNEKSASIVNGFSSSALTSIFKVLDNFKSN